MEYDLYFNSACLYKSNALQISQKVEKTVSCSCDRNIFSFFIMNLRRQCLRWFFFVSKHFATVEQHFNTSEKKIRKITIHHMSVQIVPFANFQKLHGIFLPCNEWINSRNIGLDWLCCKRTKTQVWVKVIWSCCYEKWAFLI